MPNPTTTACWMAKLVAENAVHRAQLEVNAVRAQLTAAQRRLRAAERHLDAARLNWQAAAEAVDSQPPAFMETLACN